MAPAWHAPPRWGRSNFAGARLTGHCRTAATARSGDEIEVLGDARAILAEGVRETPDAAPRLGEVVVAERDVQQIHVPRQLDVLAHVGLDDLPGDGQRRVLRHVVDVAVARAPQ